MPLPPTPALLAPSSATLKPPVAKVQEHKEVRHGETVVDPYHWLREKANPEVIAYLEAENAYADAVMKPTEALQEALYREMLGRIQQTDLQVPVPRGGWLYYARTEEGKQYPIRCRRKGSMDAPEEVVLDLNVLAEGHSYLGLGDIQLSPDGNLLAYTVDTTGFRQYALQIKDLRSGKTLGDRAERVTSVAWSADGSHLFYTTEDAVTKRSDRFWRHEVGTDRHVELYHEADELYRLAAALTRDKKLVVLHIESFDTSEARLVPAERPLEAPKVLYPRRKGHRYDVDHGEGLLYVRTNQDAQDFRIVTAPESDPDPRNWKTLVPHRPGVLVEGVDLFRDFAVVHEKTEGVNRLEVVDLKTGKGRRLELPEAVCAADPAENAEYGARSYRFNYQSLVTPPSVFEADLATGKQTLLKRQEVLGGYDPAGYATERLWAPARDGARIPLSVVYRKGLKRDGKAPMLLYGYGSYGLGLRPTFESQRLSYLDRGFVFVVAHIRGGDEMGEAWHDAGKLMAKKNTFTDFIDAAEYLVKEKWTSPDRLVAEGRSAGGLLMGAVTNMRPDLFKGVLAVVPFVDVMNTMMDASLPLTVGEYLEWGDPNQKAAYAYMKSYSPYDNLEKKAYPSMLVRTGLNDSQVMYWEPAKYVAKLRTLKTDPNPLLLKTNMGAGHGGASGRYDALKERAWTMAWVLAQVGISK